MTEDDALWLIDALLKTDRLNDVQELVLRQVWADKTYIQIALEKGYDPDYIKFVGSRLWQLLSNAFGEKITKNNFKSAFRRKFQELRGPLPTPLDSPLVPLAPMAVLAPERNGAAKPQQTTPGQTTPGQTTVTQPTAPPVSIPPEAPSRNGSFPPVSGRVLGKHQDWGESVDVSIFFGRNSELSQLKEWILQDHCRMISILAMGGMGKTTLSVKLSEQVHDQMDFVIWKSLRNAPPIEELLHLILQFLREGREVEVPQDLGEQITQLMQHLREHRCLLVFDNLESILSSGDSAGQYRPGYEGYGQLLKRIGEERHQSCLVLTSREKPREFIPLEGDTLPVRSLMLTGLGDTETRDLFRMKGTFSGSDQDWHQLNRSYAGNPLALKIAATTIKELFDGDVSEFLAQSTAVFDDIRLLVQQQFDRLSELEETVMYWLAIEREAVTLSDLQKDVMPLVMKARLMEALGSLGRRSLIERYAGGYTQQPVVMEFTTERFIERMTQEILSGQLKLFMSHALMKAQAKDYLRDSQRRVILDPIAQQMELSFPDRVRLEKQLEQVRQQLREQFLTRPGYGAGNLINLYRQLHISLHNLDFSHLSVWQADLQYVDLKGVNFAHADLSSSVFLETLSSVLQVVFSPNGKLLVTSGDANGDIRVWQLADYKQLATLQGHSSWVWSVAFSPDNRWLISGAEDNTVKIWDLHTYQCWRTLRGHTGWVRSVAVSPDGRRIASGSEDSTIRLWDLATGQLLHTLLGHTSRVWSVAFSSDNRWLASGSEDHSIKVWDLATGQCRWTLHGHSSWVWTLTFSPDGIHLASGGHDQTIRLWEIRTGTCEMTLTGHTHRIHALSFSPDGSLLASGSYDETVKIWDLPTKSCLRTLQGHASQIWSVSFHPNGYMLASGSDDQTVRLWDAYSGQCLKTLKGYSNGIWTVACGAGSDGTVWFASGSEDQRVRIWNARTGDCRYSLQGHTSWIRSVAFSPDGRWLASSSEDQTVRIWSLATGQSVLVLEGHNGWVWSVAFSPDGRWLASSSEDQTIRLWDAQTGECLNILNGHTDWVWSVQFAPRLNEQGYTLASASHDHTIKLWDPIQGTCLNTLTGHQHQVHTVTFHPEGHQLASGGHDHTIKIWDAHTGECLQTLAGHQDRVWCLAFAPDGNTLASASHDGTIRLWDPQTGVCCRILTGHGNRVHSIAFTPLVGGPNRLISGSQDETIKLWDPETGACLSTLRPVRPYEGMNIESASGVTEAQAMTLKTLGAVSAVL